MQQETIKAEDFIGLTKKSAQDRCENKNLIFRLIKIDDNLFLPYPDPTDIRTDRVCCELEGGKVVKAVLQ